jgi:hypothetical protein
MLKRSKVIDEMVKSERVHVAMSYYSLESGVVDWWGAAESKKGK